MSFTIMHGMIPVVDTIPNIYDRVSTCGAISFELISGALPIGSVTFNSADGSISVETSSGFDVGTHDFVVEAKLASYSVLDHLVSISLPFSVTVDSVCP